MLVTMGLTGRTDTHTNSFLYSNGVLLNFKVKKTRTTIVVSNVRYTFYQIHFIKHNLSNTIFQIPFIKYLLSNILYQIPFIKYCLSNTICSKKKFNESMNQQSVFRTAYLPLKRIHSERI